MGAGLVATGMMLIAMRPDAGTRGLSTLRMTKRLAWVAGVTMSVAALTGVVAWLFQRPHPLSRDHRFTLVWMTHLGAYSGGALALVGVICTRNVDVVAAQLRTT
jgi:hypothetical protein